ncbi:MAG: 30S ribosomal protein S20 [Spirochaetia bacterium]|jgi:small subunit ribosomal protein S20|nr:30S ribosomal protein S20 [Spirochaetia bacterium]
MIKTDQAAKRYRQSETRRLRNRMSKSTILTAKKRFLAAVKDNNKETAGSEFTDIVKLLDTSVGKGLFHKKTVARKKSRLRKVLNSMNA